MRKQEIEDDISALVGFSKQINPEFEIILIQRGMVSAENSRHSLATLISRLADKVAQLCAITTFNQNYLEN